MDASTEDANSDVDDSGSSDGSLTSQFTDPLEDNFISLSIGSGPQHQPSNPDNSHPSASSPGRGDIVQIPSSGTTERITFPPWTSAPPPTAEVHGRGRTLRQRRLRGLPFTPSGDRIREVVRRPRCGLHLLRSLRNDKELCVPEARSNPSKAPRHPGKADKHFRPKDGDLLLHHVKKLGKRVVEFLDPEQPLCLEDGDYLLRFKVENYSFMHQSFVTARGYLFHHGHWVYLGKDSDQMELA